MKWYIIAGIIVAVIAVAYFLIRRKKISSWGNQSYSNNMSQDTGGSILSKAKGALHNLACCLKKDT